MNWGEKVSWALNMFIMLISSAQADADPQMQFVMVANISKLS